MGALKQWMQGTVLMLCLMLDSIESRAKAEAISYIPEGDPNEFGEEENFYELFDRLEDVSQELERVIQAVSLQCERLRETEEAEWEEEKKMFGQKKGWKRLRQLHENRLEVIRNLENSLREDGYYHNLIDEIVGDRIKQLEKRTKQ